MQKKQERQKRKKRQKMHELFNNCKIPLNSKGDGNAGDLGNDAT